MSTEVWIVEKCAHGEVERHVMTDGQGFSERNIVGWCPGGSRREVTIDYTAALEALRVNRTPYVGDMVKVSEIIDAALSLAE